MIKNDMTKKTQNAVACALLLGLSSANAAEFNVTVDAGKFDRVDTLVSFKLADCECEHPNSLVAEDGTTLPLQVAHGNTFYFMLPSLNAGEKAVFKAVRVDSPAPDQVLVHTHGDRIEVSTASGAHILGYQGGRGELPRDNIKEAYRRGGYIHPVTSPGGFKVTNDYPAQHVHHHGIWFPWTKTEFQGRHPDFWNMGQETGRVEFVDLERKWSGPVVGGFQATHKFVDLSVSPPVTALNETWTVTIHAARGGENPVHVFDLLSEQTCATNDPLILPDYHYGGVGLRGLEHWLGEENTLWLTSSGETDRLKGNFTTGRWCHMYGTVALGSDKLTGTTVMGHPENFRAPQPMRLHPKEPFLCFAPSQQGDWAINPGETYTSRYRYFVFDGEPDSDLIETWWNDYVHPPQVVITTN